MKGSNLHIITNMIYFQFFNYKQLGDNKLRLRQKRLFKKNKNQNSGISNFILNRIKNTIVCNAPRPFLNTIHLTSNDPKSIKKNNIVHSFFKNQGYDSSARSLIELENEENDEKWIMNTNFNSEHDRPQMDIVTHSKMKIMSVVLSGYDGDLYNNITDMGSLEHVINKGIFTLKL